MATQKQKKCKTSPKVPNLLKNVEHPKVPNLLKNVEPLKKHNVEAPELTPFKGKTQAIDPLKLHLLNQSDSLENCLKKVTDNLKNDKGYRESWKASIALSFFDTYNAYLKKKNKKNASKDDLIKISNLAAEKFLKLLCD